MKKAELKAVMDKLDELEESLKASKQKQKELTEQAEDCRVRFHMCVLILTLKSCTRLS